MKELAQLDASYIFRSMDLRKCRHWREYLELVKDTDIITNIELKTGCLLSIRVLSRKSMTCSENSIWWTALLFLPSIIIQSFVVKAIDPAIKCGMLEESRLINAELTWLQQVWNASHPFFKNMTPENVAEVKFTD